MQEPKLKDFQKKITEENLHDFGLKKAFLYMTVTA